MEDIINIDTFKFEDDSLDEHFNNLGRNVKYYNILTYHYNNKGDIYKLMEGIKQDIKENIKTYYECNEDERNIIKLLYFSTKTQYKFEHFLDIVKYIPFKYFIPRIIKDKKNELYIQVYFAFPLIEIIVNELLENIIYFDLNIYQKLSENKEIDGGARGQMFEKFVTYYLNPKAYNINSKKFFEDINITDNIEIDKFIPRKNEKIKEKK